MINKKFPEIIIVQPAIPSYRLSFFERVYLKLKNQFKVYASKGNLDILTKDENISAWRHFLGPLRPLWFGMKWQCGALKIPIKKNNIIIVSGAPRVLTNILLLLKIRIKGAKSIWWGHYWSSTSKYWRAWIRWKIMLMADCIIFYTDQEVKTFNEKHSKRISIPVYSLNNGIENEKIRTLRKPYCARERRNRIIFIGRLTEKSKIGLLLEALNHPKLQDITLDVIGEGKQLEKYLKQDHFSKRRGRIVWHGGIIDEDRIASIANHCSLFVYPGAVGLSLIHMLNYGLPAVIHRNISEHGPEVAVWKEGYNGYGFLQGSVDSLAKTITKALSQEEQLKLMSKAAIYSTESTFNCKDMAERFFAIINNEAMRNQPNTK